VHHAHHIIQRARHHVRAQRKEDEMARHSAEDKAAAAKVTAGHRETAAAKGAKTLPKGEGAKSSGTPTTIPRTGRRAF